MERCLPTAFISVPPTGCEQCQLERRNSGAGPVQLLGAQLEEIAVQDELVWRAASLLVCGTEDVDVLDEGSVRSGAPARNAIAAPAPYLCPLLVHRDCLGMRRWSRVGYHSPERWAVC